MSDRMKQNPTRTAAGHQTKHKPSTLVVGGGLAGIAASVELARAGHAVTLVETRKRLGGRATSFVDPATGQVLDNCQHVLLGCCTNLIALYRLLGVDKQIRWHSRLFFVDAQGVIDTLEADDLPAPLHLTRSLMAFRSFSWSHKLAIARGMTAILRVNRSAQPELHDRNFEQWLQQHGQPPDVIRRFWSVIITSALNEQPSRVDAYYAIQVFQDGFLANAQAYLMGVPDVPLVRLYDQAQALIERQGGQVRLSTSADQFEFDPTSRRVTALHLAHGGKLTADAFLAAVPFDRLRKLCSPAMLQSDARLATLDQFDVSPIIGVHLWVTPPTGSTCPVMATPHLIFTDSPLHWLFNKGFDQPPQEPTAADTVDPTHGCQHLHGVISAAHDLVNRPAREIVDLTVREIRRIARGPSGIADFTLVHATVIKEKRATFSAAPGVESIRPTAAGAASNLYLAGDWCRTGWPATMEGAVRSGHQAASDLIRGPSCVDHESTLVPDLPEESVYRFLAAR